MRILIISLAATLLASGLSWAEDVDAELEERLKAVMILFDKSQQGLKEEIESLELQLSYLEGENAKLNSELEAANEEILNLKTELLLKESEAVTADVDPEVVAAELIASNSSFGNANQGPAAGRGGGRGRGQAGVPATDAVPTGDLLDINSASRDELLALPLVNEFLADNIIDGRPWDSLEDLIQLQGFGPMKLRRLTPFATALPISEISEVTASEIPVD